MPAYEWYATPVNSAGTSTAASTLVTVFVGAADPGGYDIFIFDANSDDLVDANEWQSYTGGGLGLNGGSTVALFDGSPGGAGIIYSNTAYPIGTAGLKDGLTKTFDVDPQALDPTPICFTTGTLIKTRSGEVAVEDLRVGDMVLTMDAGYQPIRWVGGRKVSAAELQINPKLKPIRICADALGPGLPQQDLLVSPQHRVVVRSPIAARLFYSAEILVPAKKLLELPGIFVDGGDAEVEYFHILFDAHQLVWSNGAVTESLFTGPEALKFVSSEVREEIAALFPEILEPDFIPTPARPILQKGKDIRNLAQRIARHGKPVQAAASGLPSVS